MESLCTEETIGVAYAWLDGGNDGGKEWMREKPLLRHLYFLLCLLRELCQNCAQDNLVALIPLSLTFALPTQSENMIRFPWTLE